MKTDFSGSFPDGSGPYFSLNTLHEEEHVRNNGGRPRGADDGRALAQRQAGIMEDLPDARRFLVHDDRWDADPGGAIGSPGDPTRRARLGVVDQASRSPFTWRIDGVLPDGAYAFVYGKFGSFKSLLGIDMAERVARGMPLAWGPDGEAETVPGPVLYIAAEAYPGVEMRRRAWEQHYGVEPSPLLDFISKPVNLLDFGAVEDLASFVRERQHKLVAIDTLHRSMAGGSEVSDTDTARVTAAVEQIQDAYYISADDAPVVPSHTEMVVGSLGSGELETWVETDPPGIPPSQEPWSEDDSGTRQVWKPGPYWSGRPAVILVHHPNQRTNTLRGHGGFYGDSDTIFRVTRRKDGTSEIFCEKQKDGRDGWNVRVQFEPVGESGIVVPVEAERGRAYSAHVRWHEKRGEVRPDCEFCAS
jgi:hypothetical protein